MPSRQLGHFFFEPQDYDGANQATHEYKEEVKVGYNLHRKAILLTIWILLPLLLLASPTLFGLLDGPDGWYGSRTTCRVVWLVLGAGRGDVPAVHLFFLRDVQTGLVWATKILTDPFHDVKLYRHAPSRCCAASSSTPRVRGSA